MQPIVTSLAASVPEADLLSPHSTPFDSSPHSPTSATLSSALSSSHHANRPTGQHNLRIVKAVLQEERLYEWRDKDAAAPDVRPVDGGSGEVGGTGARPVGATSTLWQRRQQQANRQQPQQPPS